MGHPVQKVSSNVLRRTLDDLRLNVTEFAREARVQPSSVYTWLRRGDAPAYMELVCEAVRQRRHAVPHLEERDNQVTLVVQLPEREREMMTRFLEAIRGKSTEIR